jgi:hypothetical protein
MSTTNNTKVGLPSVGVADGTSDKLILAAGTASIYPYSLGINTKSLWYSVPSGASHIFYHNGVNTLSLSSSALTTNGNIDCGGGIVINGSNAFYTTTTIDVRNLTNTYFNLKDAGANSGWCYIRQIGASNAYKLAFDFHDDVDA